MSFRCSVCENNINFLYNNFPLYYFGAGPNDPHKAKEYFCGPICSNKRHKEINDMFKYKGSVQQKLG